MAADVASGAAAAEDAAAAPSVAVDDAAAIAKSPVGVAERVASVRPRPSVRRKRAEGGGVASKPSARRPRPTAAARSVPAGDTQLVRKIDGEEGLASSRARASSRSLAGLGAATCKNIRDGVSRVEAGNRSWLIQFSLVRFAGQRFVSRAKGPRRRREVVDPLSLATFGDHKNDEEAKET